MQPAQNFTILPYGDLLPVFFDSLPLIIWIYYIIKVPIPWLKEAKNLSASKYLIVLSMLLPFIIVAFNFYSAQYGTDYDFSTAELTPGWQFCLTTKNISPENSKNGVVGIWDLKCGKQQTKMNNNIATDLVSRFYYLSNALFIFILVIYNSLTVDILKSKHITKSIIFCLLLGILGMLPAIFNTYYLKSLLFNRLTATLLTMNIASFFLVIIGILIRMRVK
jgi:hypothetical protein